jgi:hypothetical protein
VVEKPIDTMILSALPLHWKFPEIDINLSNGFHFATKPPQTKLEIYQSQAVRFDIYLNGTVQTLKKLAETIDKLVRKN